jgi:hypothetical protein
VLDRLPLTMGRSSGCGIRLSEQFVSRQHATLTMSEDGVLLEVQSSNGMEIGGKMFKRGKYVLLGTGDVLKCGQETEILFVDAGDNAEAALAAVQAARKEEMEARRAREQARLAQPEQAAAPEESPALSETPVDEEGPAPMPAKPPRSMPAQGAEEAGREPSAPLSPLQADALLRQKRLRRRLVALGIYVLVIIGVGVALKVFVVPQRTTAENVPLLTAEQIKAILKDPLGEGKREISPNSQKAAEALVEARRHFLLRQVNPGDGYWTVYNYEIYKVLASRAAFAEATDQESYDTALTELTNNVVGLYDSACKAAQQERWKVATDAFEQIVGNGKVGKEMVAGVVPDQSNPLNKNVQRQLKRIKDTVAASQKKVRTGPLG